MPEPFHDTASKFKPSIHIHSTDGLTGGGCAADRVGMRIGPGALQDHWGLAHEFTPSWQSWWSQNGGLSCADANNCRWIAENHANYTAHQLPEYHANVHCVFQTIVADQDYASIWRYPYMIELANAWPQGFRGGQRDACPAGTVRHANGGGCAPAGTPATAFVGPYALVLPCASVSGTARIEDQAIVTNGSVTGGTVGGLSVVGELGGNAFTVSGAAQVRTTFYPLGFFEAGQGASGSLNLYGDVEYRGAGLNLGAGNRSGFVDATSSVGSATDINAKTTWAWRP